LSSKCKFEAEDIIIWSHLKELPPRFYRAFYRKYQDGNFSGSPGLVLSIRSFSVADPGCSSRFPNLNFFHPGSALKNLSILSPKKWFLSSRKYDGLGCSFRVRIPDPDFLPIPDQGGSKGHRIADPDSQHWDWEKTLIFRKVYKKILAVISPYYSSGQPD
jgi:hypothetical protein